jgi:hypothetical protein
MIKNRIIRYIKFLTVITPVFFASCESVRYASTKVQTLTPPTRIIDLPDTANIAISAAILNDSYLPENETLPDSLTSIATAMAIKNYMEKSPKYSSYIFPVYTINVGDNGLTEENLLDIKENSNANYLISVEKFQSVIHKQRIKTSRNNCVRIAVPHSAVIKIYDIDKKLVIDERLINDTLSVQIDAYAWETEEEIMEKLPNNKSAVLLVIKEMAKTYVEEVAPFWKEETRFYYITDVAAKAEEHIYNEDWSKAMDIWIKYVNDENRRLAAISCFNMAVGCEMLGEYELALKWMENVKRKDATYYWEEYKNRLEKRLVEKAILDRIMN